MDDITGAIILKDVIGWGLYSIIISILFVFAFPTGGPGYEQALALGIFFPLPLCIYSTHNSLHWKGNSFHLLVRLQVFAFFFIFLIWFLVTIHGVFFGLCDLYKGSLWYILGPLFGCSFACVWGVLSHQLVKKKIFNSKFIYFLSLFGPMGGISLSVWRFYTSPIVFAYDPFFGFFSGSIYDTVLSYKTLILYRGWSLLILLLGLVILHVSQSSLPSSIKQVIDKPSIRVVCFLSLLNIGIFLNEEHFGFVQSETSIRNKLGGKLESTNCEVVFDASLLPKESERILNECEGYVDQGRRWFNLEKTPKVTVFLFRDSEQKLKLMGAENTYIAKPWRHEVYVQPNGFPHPVLGHELMHVLTSEFGRGPFKVAGFLNGWIPNPGLIEGIAVAASEEDEEASVIEWAKSMKDGDLLPKLDRLFGLSFWQEQGARAYIASGSFIEFLRDRYGVDLVKKWYGGENLEDLTNMSWIALEAEWKKWLDQVSIDDNMRNMSIDRFSGKGIWLQICPHVVDECVKLARESKGKNNVSETMKQYERANEFDRGIRLQLEIIQTKIFFQEWTSAKNDLEKLETKIPKNGSVRARFLQMMGDLSWMNHSLEKAIENYDQAMNFSVSMSMKRQLDIRNWFVQHPGTWNLSKTLLFEQRGKFVSEQEEKKNEENDAILDYLMGRQFFLQGKFELSEKHFEKSIEEGIELERVSKDTYRMLFLIACDGKNEQTLFERYVDYVDHPLVQKQEMKVAKNQFLRCKFME